MQKPLIVAAEELRVTHCNNKRGLFDDLIQGFVEEARLVASWSERGV